MFDADLANNPNTALTAGTSSNLTFSLKTGAGSGVESLRAVGSVATTNPHQIKIAHSTRRISGLRLTSGNELANDIVVDRHLIRVDKNVSVTGVSDPDFRVNYGAQLVVELPRIGGDTPTTQLVMDQILRLLVALNPSTNAGLIRLLNGEL